jgi:hypothetical protein
MLSPTQGFFSPVLLLSPTPFYGFNSICSPTEVLNVMLLPETVSAFLLFR